MRKFALAAGAAALVGATLLQFYPALIPPPPASKTRQLNDLLPAKVPGWAVQDLPIAESEEMRATVNQRLRYDDHLVRLYSRGNVRVMVYVAYWLPGKQPYRMVGAHSPDTCWVQNGWTRVDRDQWSSCPSGETFAQPIEFGTYAREGTLENVIFWHLVGGQVYGFEQHGLHNPFGIFHDFLTFGLSQRREQYFIRVSSNLPFDRLWADPDIHAVLDPLWQFGSSPLLPARTPAPAPAAGTAAAPATTRQL